MILKHPSQKSMPYRALKNGSPGNPFTSSPKSLNSRKHKRERDITSLTLHILKMKWIKITIVLPVINNKTVLIMVPPKVPSDLTSVWTLFWAYLDDSVGYGSGLAQGMPTLSWSQACPSAAHNPWRDKTQNGPSGDGKQSKLRRTFSPRYSEVSANAYYVQSERIN